MRIVIHVEIGKVDELSYTKSILSWIRQTDPHVLSYDFDNHSDSAVINHGIELLKKGDDILVIIDQHSNQSIARLLKFVDSLIRSRSKNLFVIFNGAEPSIDRMLGTLPEGQLVKNIDHPTQQFHISQFFGFGSTAGG